MSNCAGSAGGATAVNENKQLEKCDASLGTLAVVGPTRMNYARVIPLVDLTARELSRAIGRHGDG